MNYRILGVDPGFARTGWGLIDTDGIRHRHVDHGMIVTDSSHTPERRLLELYGEMTSLLEASKPVAMGVEKLFFKRNISSALPVAQAMGVVLLAAAQNNLVVKEYTPNTVKQSIVGTGQADKAQVQNMIKMILSLKETPKSDHSADALAVAITLIHHEMPW